MPSDQQLIGFVHRRQQWASRWGKVAGIVFIAFGLASAITGCGLICYATRSVSVAVRLAARGHPNTAQLDAMLQGQSFYLGIGVGAFLMFFCAGGLFAAGYGVSFLRGGGWRDRLIVRLVERSPAAG